MLASAVIASCFTTFCIHVSLLFHYLLFSDVIHKLNIYKSKCDCVRDAPKV
jgi:hypothetical protein